MAAMIRAGTPMAFTRCSHSFTVTCDDPAIREFVWRVLQRFAVEGAGKGERSYEVRDLGSSDVDGRYSLLIDGERVLGSRDPADVLDDLFAHVNLDTIKATRDLVLVHAGAVVTPGGEGVVLPAPSGSGKSTLVAGLVRAGFGYLSDESAVLDPHTGTLHASPTHLSLKATSRDRFPNLRPASPVRRFSREIWHVDPDAIRPGAVASPCEIAFVIPHFYESGAETLIEPLTAAEACMNLVRNLMFPRRDAARSLGLLARVCKASKTYQLRSGDLDEAVETILEVTAG
jgi:hypothetical protein